MVRTKHTGRAVPEAVIRRTNAMSAKTFYKLYTRFDEAILFNNSKQLDSDSVAPFAIKQLRQLLPYNNDEFRLFISKVNS